MYSLTFYIFTRIFSEEREDIKIGKNRPAIQNTQQHLMLFECIKVLKIKIKSQNFFFGKQCECKFALSFKHINILKEAPSFCYFETTSIKQVIILFVFQFNLISFQRRDSKGDLQDSQSTFQKANFLRPLCVIKMGLSYRPSTSPKSVYSRDVMSQFTQNALMKLHIQQNIKLQMSSLSSVR